MSLRILLLGLLVGVGIDAGPAFGAHETLSVLLPGNPLEGSRLFTGKGCLRCHAVHEVGGTAGPGLGRGILNRPLLEIAGVMWNHSPTMEHGFRQKRIVRPEFEPSEMASLLAFLYYLGSLDPPGDAAVGARLFRQKGCQICHSLGGKGGNVGPKLDKYSQYVSPLHLTASLWRKGKAMAEKMEEKRVRRPVFEGNDIPDLLAYIRSVGGGKERIYVAPGNPKRGEELFTEKRCVECHSIRGHGGKVGPDLGLKLKGSLTRIAGSMWNHGPKMWAKMAERGIEVPGLTEVEMGDLISYLYFFQFIDPPADMGRGWVVYKEKRCGACHAATGAGNPVAPPIRDLAEKLRNPVEIITAMWRHGGKMEEKMLQEDISWPVLKGGEMADLMAYLLSIPPEAGSLPAGSGGSQQKGQDSKGKTQLSGRSAMSRWIGRALKLFTFSAAIAASPALAQVEIVAKKVAEGPAVDGKVDKIWDSVRATKVTATEGPQGDVEISLKVLYTEKDIYFLFQWPDKTMSLNRLDEFNGKEWKRVKGNEDLFNLMWDIGNTVKDFPVKGCTAVCHKQGKKVTLKTNGPAERLDVWHWKAQRSNPVGYAEDEWLGHELKKEGDDEIARGSDAKAGGGYVENWDREAKRPKYTFKEGKKPGPVLLRSDALEIKDHGKFKAGDRLPHEALEKPAGSRGDIEAKAVWERGRWTLEMKRARDTGDKENDVQFSNLERPYYFGISVHDDDQGDAHSHTDRTALKLLLK